MGASYRSASAGFSLFYVLLFAAGCGEPEPVTTELFVRPHLVPSCEPDDGSTVTLAALGPFPPSNQTVENLPLFDSTRELRFPADTSAVEAVATDGARRYLGYTDRRRDGGFELSLLPERRECALFAPEDGYPRDGTAKALGFSPATGVLFAAGGRNEEELSQGALAFDLDRASVYRIPDPEAELCPTCGLHSARAHATVTEFGAQLLVAGGEPPDDADQTDPGDTAEVYDPELGQFQAETIRLQYGRTRHAAIVLRNGQTLLVGGRNAAGLVNRLEVVSPESRRSAYLGLAALETPREHPQVVRLSDDRVFVGGGVDASGGPVSWAQWFTADASKAVGDAEGGGVQIPLPARHDWSFVGLPGGGVIGVAGCDPAREPDEACDANCCRARCGAERGCPSDTAIWFTRDRTAIELRAPATFSAPLLAPGSDGSPWLVDAGLPATPVYRFNPWRAEFQRTTATLAAPPGRRPDPERDGFGPPPPLVSLGPDTFAWFSAEEPPRLMAFRGGTRGPLSNDLPLVVLTDVDDPTRPAHLAPDRRAASDLVTRNQQTMQNELGLAAGEGAPRVWLTDARFGDVTLRIDYRDAPPRLLVDALEVGSGACPWPLPDETSGSLSVARRGATLYLAQGRASTRCDGPDGDVSLGVRAGAQPSHVSRLEVVRD
jgi:hypothetical protein